MASSAHAATDQGLIYFWINGEPPISFEKHPTVTDAADVSPNVVAFVAAAVHPQEQRSLPGTSAAALAALVGVVPASLVDGASAMVVEAARATT